MRDLEFREGLSEPAVLFNAFDMHDDAGNDT
jgi:hypothetical protein